MILDIELPALRKVDVSYIQKIKKLLVVIGKSAPFIPNVSELASQIGIARQTLLIYFSYLEESRLINQLFRQTRGLGTLEKPDKLFLENTNLMYALNGIMTDVGNMRETFVYNQLAKNHDVLYSMDSDFFVDEKYTFEVGGKNKKKNTDKKCSEFLYYCRQHRIWNRKKNSYLASWIFILIFNKKKGLFENSPFFCLLSSQLIRWN